MPRSELFHVGIIVPDLEAGCGHFTELLGVNWGPIVEGLVDVRDAAGNDLVAPNRVCYTTDPPYLELIEEQPGTPWVCNEFSNLHHIGYFIDDLAAGSASLSAAGCPLEWSGRRGSRSPEMFSYNHDPLKVRIEYVDVAIRPIMEAGMFADPG